MSTIPPRNLPVAAEPWGRSVDLRVSTLEKSASKYQQDTDNALSGLNSTTTKLSEQVAAIDELTQKLAEQQEVLEEQQAQLTAQVAQIEALVNATVYAQGAGVLVTGGALAAGGSYVPLAETVVPVPSGYTSAAILAIATVNGDDTSGSGLPALRARIEMIYSGGSVFGSSTVGRSGPLQETYTTCHARASLVGLTPGSTITLRVWGFANTAHNDVQSDLDAILTFTR